MDTRSVQHSQLYKAAAVILSIALAFSLVPPEGRSLLPSVGIAHAAPVTTGLVSALPSGCNLPIALLVLFPALW